MTIAELQARIGYTFTEKALLEAALTHSSHGAVNYERLEFLGDRVLGFVVGNWLWEMFPEADEGELSRRIMAMVREMALVKVSEAWAIGPYVRLGAGESLKNSILADIVEAILGAVWRDGGLKAVDGVVRANWLIDFEDVKDSKTRLQEFLQGQGLGLPIYDVVGEQGPDHDKYFEVKVITAKGDCIGQGRSKQAASAAAAELLMKKLENE